MEGDKLSGGITPLNFKLGSRQMTLNPLATLLPEEEPWFTLSGCWSWSGYFGEDIGILLLSRFEPQIFQLMSWSLYRLCCPIMVGR